MYIIKTPKGYVTRRGKETDLSYTPYKDFAYVFDDIIQVEAAIKYLRIIAEIIQL